jgi:phage terminase small subunit
VTKNKDHKVLKFTPKQEKFIENYVKNFGIKSATQCAIDAGYERSSAHTRASEMLDFRLNKAVAREIESRLAARRELWNVTKETHAAELTRIRDEAMEKGHYGVAGKMAELRGKLFGLYIEKHMTLETKLDEEQLKEKLLTYFDSEEEAKEAAEQYARQLFGIGKKKEV